MSQVATLIYKRTHSGDPDPRTGVFGNNDCMGSVRDLSFGAVIGVGGVGEEAKRNGIAGKLTWVGIGPHRHYRRDKFRGPVISFDLFRYYGTDGDALSNVAPELAKYVYGNRVRFVLGSQRLPTKAQREVEQLLSRVRNDPLSKRRPPSTHRSGIIVCRPSRVSCLSTSHRAVDLSPIAGCRRRRKKC
jgi:hypothetical protein